jgi:mono/diheme cytochrome c family protein
MRNFVLGALSGAFLLLVVGTLYLRLGFAEVRGDLPPSPFETRLMTASVHAAVRRQAAEASNPVAPTEENLIAGGKLYSGGCAGCHGNPGSSEDNGDTLFPPVPQLPKVGTDYTEAQIFWVAKHGIRRTGMFANGKWNSDRELWTMAAYIKLIRELPPAVQKALEAKKPEPPK